MTVTRHATHRTVAALLTTALALLAVPASSTYAATAAPRRGGPVSLVNEQSGECLQLDGNGEARTAGCDSGGVRSWLIAGDGLLQDTADGTCLEEVEGGRVVAQPCQEGNPAQQWQPKAQHFANQATGGCLTAWDGRVASFGCDAASSYQKWRTEQ
ncbi:RICIN domain-containing protein [Kitasatospora mediocidica]|uniref:RICIN domain-containing protein n=1 Tax=Kitasatospora mediocidica TaxID=58352 RepID=UPI00056D1DCC|nr:ricin-type beta-trefoil lectin domain protein [Kitasatospora mediocidica]